jgi:hypothetical protein
MGVLRGSSKENAVKALQANLLGELLDTDENYAESYIKWCIKQLQENKNNNKHINLKKVLRQASSEAEKISIEKQIRVARPKGFPRDIKRGDIVHVKFGINLGDEISDLQKDNTMKADHGHYSVVLAQKGFMFLVVPLSSHKQHSNDPDLAMCIKGLGIGDSDESHVVFSQMQSVHIRRIKNIQSLLPVGKKGLDPVVLGELDNKIAKYIGINAKIEEISLEKV